MRVLGWMVLVILLPGRVWAMPEPPPPGDFPGAQYIDRSGCVFVRKGEAWEPRTDKQGAPICGFPPSQPALADTTQFDPPPSPEEALAEVLAQGLKSGDLVTDASVTLMAEIAPDPAQAVLDATLQGQIDMDAGLRSAMAGQAPDGLCARLGYRPAASQTPIIGGDVTQGLCPGMTAPDPKSQITGTAAIPAVKTATPGPSATDTPAPKPVRQRESAPKPASVVVRRQAAPKDERSTVVEMIPANARYVEIGTYGDPANAMSALRRLTGMGYRTAQRDQKVEDNLGKAILAGPFADRQALVAALARLRANGWPRAMAR
jgi:cell division septation protein DedD